jgi:hypothetical protein
MGKQFIIPDGLVGRFAVVKLWPELKAAEDECIARIKNTAAILGLECVEVHANGTLIENPEEEISKNNVDFVLHLHYDSPKYYDAFSFVALWNPVYFYHEWGYSRCSRNLSTHDDFLSCSSPAADDHVGRIVRKSRTHLPAFFNLYHSLADVVYPPSLGDKKLFYVGINWEALRDGISRHQEVLKKLDKTGLLRIYGPRKFQGIKVWAGYESYIDEIPFDGISMIDEISKAGISLVLSSEAHKESELMSNRLFESVAAGALVICDENNFAKKYFGDSLLYIDTRCSVEEICRDISNHLSWAESNADEALRMISKAQDIFRQKFTLKNNLIDLYMGFVERKQDLLQKQFPENKPDLNIHLNLLIPEYSDTVLTMHVSSVVAQEYKNFTATLVFDKEELSKNRSRIENIVKKSQIAIELLEIDFFLKDPTQNKKTRRKIGVVLYEILDQSKRKDAIVFVAPNERLFSNHLQVLAGSLVRDPAIQCAATAAILKHSDRPVKGIHERIDFREINAALPNGFGRFIFRTSALPRDLKIALPYMDRKALAILVGENKVCQEHPATVVIDLENDFLFGPWDEGQENNIISQYSPEAFKASTGLAVELPPLTQIGTPKRLLSFVRRIRIRWIVAQIKAIRREGIVPRLQVLKAKLETI